MTFQADYMTGYEMGAIPLPSGDDSSLLETTDVNTGNYCSKIGPPGLTGSSTTTHTLPVARSDFYMSIYVKTDGVAEDNRNQIRFGLAGTSSIISLRYSQTSDNWDVYIAGSKVADGSVTATDGSWVHIQVHIVVSDAGLIHTKIEGETDVLYYGDTSPGGATGVDQVMYYVRDETGTQFRQDDLCTGTGGWPGAIRIKGYAVNGDTITDEFEKSSGTDAYALVDEIGPDTSDYVYADADGEQLIMDVADFGETGVTPTAVSMWAYAQKTTGNADKLAFISQLAGENKQVHSQQSIVNSTWRYIYEVLNDAPDGTPWTDAHLDDLEMGFDAEIV